ncbi:hypothetical protein ACKI1O_43040 [Streptomyces scabiei]
MDYPYVEVKARNADGGGVTALVQFTGGDLAVTEADIVTAVSERLAAVPGVTGVTATRQHVVQTIII